MIYGNEKNMVLRYICTIVKCVIAARAGILAKTVNLQQHLAETRRNTSQLTAWLKYHVKDKNIDQTHQAKLVMQSIA